MKLFLCLEFWLNRFVKNAEINIEGYKLFRQDRLGMRGGGVGVYIRVLLKPKSVNTLLSLHLVTLQ